MARFPQRGRGSQGGLKSGVGLFFVCLVVIFGSWMTYSMFRIDVGTGEMAILVHKVGKDLGNDDELASSAEYKGVQVDVLTEGRHFRNPFFWDWEVIPQTVIPEGKLGVKVSLTGEDLGYGEFLARMKDESTPLTKGVVPGVMRPGRYPINPYVFAVEEHLPVTIDAGYKGVVTNLTGRMPENPNALLVATGERGVQPDTLDPGTYYVNPYETRINQLDCRSQRFNLSQSGEMGFPSKDGFWVRLDGIIEFRVNPEKAAEVYVTYNEDTNGDQIDEELILKVILPNARSFCRLQGSNSLGRDFIQGETRTKFQEDFQEAMRTACEPLGIEIIQALITRIRPPDQIAAPVRDREIAKQEELQYQQQILQQESEQKLAVETALVGQKRALVEADQKVVKLTTEAKREQEVAVTKANEQLKVAEYKLEAAKDEAAAILARGQAEADIIRFQNEAEAAGWKTAVEAFSGNGMQYAQFVMFEKMAKAYRQIMVNTADSPIMRVFEAFDPSVTAPSVPQDSVTADAPVDEAETSANEVAAEASGNSAN
ncbi:SPFH domain / Band 7 family protein [Maioricimonas rarisocia]|uniref:SPFH domain / Band 7 family protein n=1 Tax=Maioricimonas rarisocia TaxID=2528026 RepID=A0A517Z3J2_9PLAN|nr:SPFH domain / Band 7 family protein [Maioricimonas rarisocia]